MPKHVCVCEYLSKSYWQPRKYFQPVNSSAKAVISISGCSLPPKVGPNCFEMLANFFLQDTKSSCANLLKLKSC